MTVAVVVIEPLQSLPGLFGQPHRDARQASSSRQNTAIDTHSAAIIPTPHLLIIVSPIYLNEPIARKQRSNSRLEYFLETTEHAKSA
jgi:hypothetical protein